MEQIDAEDFLEELWGNREGWVDLPAKVGRYWIPYYQEWPPSYDLGISRRIDQCNRDQEDLYYSVAMFKNEGRRIEDVMPLCWLWADLDVVHPSRAVEMGLTPTFVVESSPDRWQALWKLNRLVKPSIVEKLNRALTYALGADRGGWDLTQVLRVPDTHNWKYDGGPRVRITNYNPAMVYDHRWVLDKVKEHVPEDELKVAVGMKLPRRDIPRTAQRLLMQKPDMVMVGERSDVMWQLERTLARSGCTEEEIYDLVVDCAWNRWKGQRGMRGRLMREISKAVRTVRQETVAKQREKQAVAADDGGREESTDRLPAVAIANFMAAEVEAPEWLVKDIWTAGSQGIIGGEPKTSKTTLALALGMSVASGADFLGRYPCSTTGPVLIVQEENAPGMMQDRMKRLAGYMDIEVDETPLWILNNYGFDLMLEEHREMLEAWVSEIRPVLVILDPMYLIFGAIDANAMGQIQPFLKWIIRLRMEYKCAVAVVHHMGKASQNTAGRRAGQRLIGSATLHGFTDSALYTSRVDDLRQGWTRVLIEREFRQMEPQEAFEMAWHFDPPGTLGMQLELEAKGPMEQIVDFVRSQGRATPRQITEALGFDLRTVRRYVRENDILGVEKRGNGKTMWVHVNGSPSKS